MSFKLQKDGASVLANIVAGTPGYKINGMYVEYHIDPEYAAVDKDAAYFEHLAGNDGYVRVAVTSAAVDKDRIQFTALIAPQDLQKASSIKGVKLTSATLVYMKNENVAEDSIIYTVVFKEPVQVVSNSYITVHAGLSMGA